MITQDQLDRAEAVYPMPDFTEWYLNKFPKKQFIYLELGVFIAGFISTALKMKKSIRGIATLAFVVLLVPACVIHTIAWIKMRICEKNRAKFLGVTLQEYWSAVS